MYFWTLHQIKMMKKNTVSILSHMINICTLSSCHPPNTFKGIPKRSNSFSQTNLMKSVTNIASYQNSIFLIKIIKPTKCTLQLINLVQKMENSFPIQNENRKNRVPRLIIFYPAIKVLKSILKNSLPILYTNERMTSLFNDQSMTVIKRPKNMKDIVVRAILDNPLFNGGFKALLDNRRLLYKHSTNTDSFLVP